MLGGSRTRRVSMEEMRGWVGKGVGLGAEGFRWWPSQSRGILIGIFVVARVSDGLYR